MTPKRQRPSPDQWAKLDTALETLRSRMPPSATLPLSREIVRRADALRAALESGWRIRDLAAFFREAAGIDVSPSTIQAALRQALADTESTTHRARAKRPRRRATAGDEPPPKSAQTQNTARLPATPASDRPNGVADGTAGVPRARTVTPLGTTLTQGATKRGRR